MKTKLLELIIIGFILFYTNTCLAQWITTGSDIYNSNTGNVGIGTGGSPAVTAKLEVRSTTGGFLMPRLTKVQRDAIFSPATGLIIYQTNSTPGFYYYNGSAWKAVIQKGWSLTGNSGTNPSLNFIGTTDAQPLVLKVNNQPAGKIDFDVIYANTSFGYQTFNAPLNSFACAAFGHRALYTNGGSGNSAFGASSLLNNLNGSYNTALGDAALVSNRDAFYNTAVGAYSAYSNTSGYDNTAIGEDALYHNTTGDDNTAIGFWSLRINTTGNSNTALGAGADMIANNLNNATAIGYNAIAQENDQVMLGSTLINSVKAAGSFVIYSDVRFKKNINENVPGLDFIKQLRPVTYNYDIHALNNYIGVANSMGGESQNVESAKRNEDAIMKKENKIYTGFIAQEVEKAANNLNYDFSGLFKPQNDKDTYGLSYSDFVAPIVRAIQELSKIDDEKDEKIKNLQIENSRQQQVTRDLQKQIDELRAMFASNQLAVNSKISAAKLQVLPSSLEQTFLIHSTTPQQ